MAIPTLPEFERQQFKDALEHCTEAAALGERLHHQLEQLAAGNDPAAASTLQNVVARLSVCVARMACARDQLAGLTQYFAERAGSTVRP